MSAIAALLRAIEWQKMVDSVEEVGFSRGRAPSRNILRGVLRISPLLVAASSGEA
jgi:hypothetical protein